ncbi:hypothetical protein C8Q70DRAFT_1108537 [Cubamyces menziesii]|nr:hypothetical protein C8Q70DRAFT_1108537 [Cubamyces menziesii]
MFQLVPRRMNTNCAIVSLRRVAGFNRNRINVNLATLHKSTPIFRRLWGICDPVSVVSGMTSNLHVRLRQSRMFAQSPGSLRQVPLGLSTGRWLQCQIRHKYICRTRSERAFGSIWTSLRRCLGRHRRRHLSKRHTADGHPLHGHQRRRDQL